jgi:hypothetical protein
MSVKPVVIHAGRARVLMIVLVDLLHIVEAGVPA